MVVAVVPLKSITFVVYVPETKFCKFNDVLKKLFGPLVWAPYGAVPPLTFIINEPFPLLKHCSSTFVVVNAIVVGPVTVNPLAMSVCCGDELSVIVIE